MRITFVFLFFALTNTLTAQHAVGPSIGGTLSGIHYVNSSGKRLSNLKGAPGFVAAIGYHRQFSGRQKSIRSCFTADIGYQTINIRDAESHIATTWTLRYAFASFGYRLINEKGKRVNPYAGAGAEFAYLSGGSQQRGFEEYNITENLRPVNISAVIDGGIFYNISDEAYCVFAIGYHRGLSNIEKDATQKATVSAARITMAVYFQLSKK